MSEMWIALAGIVGIVLTHWSSVWARRRDADDRREERHAKFKAAQYERRADTYVALLKMALACSTRAGTAITYLDLGLSIGQLPSLLPDDVQMDVLARANAFGHGTIGDLGEAWYAIMVVELQAVLRVQLMPDDLGLQTELRELHAKQIAAQSELAEAIRADLATPPTF